MSCHLPRGAAKAGETPERLAAVAAWREAPYFSDAVPDDVWDEASKHHTEQELAALVFWIATTNLFKVLLGATHQDGNGISPAPPTTPISRGDIPRHGDGAPIDPTGPGG